MPPVAFLFLAVSVAAAPSPECDPSYLTMEPDEESFPSITVTLSDRAGRTWTQTSSFPSVARCVETASLLRSVADRLSEKVIIQTSYKCDPDWMHGNR